MDAEAVGRAGRPLPVCTSWMESQRQPTNCFKRSAIRMERSICQPQPSARVLQPMQASSQEASSRIPRTPGTHRIRIEQNHTSSFIEERVPMTLSIMSPSLPNVFLTESPLEAGHMSSLNEFIWEQINYLCLNKTA